MAEAIAIALMAVAFVLVVIAGIRLFPGLLAEARADAAEIRAAEARARAVGSTRAPPAEPDSRP